MSQILMTILHERSVILLARPGENHTKVISSPPKRKEMMEISVSK